MTLLALQDLFRRYREKATGVWALGRDPGRTIYFDYGDAVFATSTHLQDRLTYLLVEKGKVTQAQMDYALANLKTGLSIGKNLIEMGFITQRDLLDTAKYQVERIIRGALGCADEAPEFDARDLDTNVVRLPLNTPQLLLGGILALQDREGLLELLGPLNQVVVLQGRNLQELTLPPDLAKLPPLLDGTHTLLELSRESMAEPLRLGAFALFLRELGWARLHEMPPLDRHALDLALAPEPEPIPALPMPILHEPEPEAAPSLFASIQEAARPTTNLEHLSQSLDEAAALPDVDLAAGGTHLPEALTGPADPDGLEPPWPTAPEPEAPWPDALVLGTGPESASAPTPTLPIQAMPEFPEDVPVAMAAPPVDVTPALRLPALDEPLEPPSPSPVRRTASRWLLAAAFLVLAGVATALAIRGGAAGRPTWFSRLQARLSGRSTVPAAPPRPIPMAEAPVPPATPAPAPTPDPAPPAPAPAPVPAPEPPAKPAEPALSTSIAARVKALTDGDLDLAVQQGRRLVRELPPGNCSLRLEIACEKATILRLMDLFKGHEPDVFLLPITLRDGRACYQVLYGHFPNAKAARQAVPRLPHALQADRIQPKIFQIAELIKLK